MEVNTLIDTLPKDVVKWATPNIVTYINTLGEKTGVLQEYIDEELFSNMNVLAEAGIKDLRKYIDAVAFNILRNSKVSATNAWGILFGMKNADKNVYAYSNQRMVVAVADSMDESIKTRFTGVKYKAVERLIDLMDGKAQPSIIPVYNVVNGLQEPVYNEDGSRAYKEVYMTVTPKIQLEASSKLIDVLEKGDIIQIEHSVKNEYDLLAEKLDTIAERQRQDLIDGASITDVQVIGDLLSVKDGDES